MAQTDPTSGLGILKDAVSEFSALIDDLVFRLDRGDANRHVINAARKGQRAILRKALARATEGSHQ